MTNITSKQAIWIVVLLTLLAFTTVPLIIADTGSSRDFLTTAGIAMTMLGATTLGLAGFQAVAGLRRTSEAVGTALVGIAILAQAYRILIRPSDAAAIAISLLGAIGFVVGLGLVARARAPVNGFQNFK